MTGKDKNQQTKLFGSVLGFTNAQESDPMILGPRLFLEILSVIPLLQIIPLPLHPTIRSSRPGHISPSIPEIYRIDFRTPYPRGLSDAGELISLRYKCSGKKAHFHLFTPKAPGGESEPGSHLLVVYHERKLGINGGLRWFLVGTPYLKGHLRLAGRKRRGDWSLDEGPSTTPKAARKGAQQWRDSNGGTTAEMVTYRGLGTLGWAENSALASSQPSFWTLTVTMSS